MASMTVVLPDGRGTYTLTGVCMAPLQHIRATVTDVLQENIDMVLYRVVTEGGLRVLKVGFSEGEIAAIEREARMYDKYLRELMGTDVLKFHGSYTGQNEDGKKAECLVVENFGSVVEFESIIVSLPMSQR